MAGQVMEAQQARLHPPSSTIPTPPFAPLMPPHNCKNDDIHNLTTTAAATPSAADTAASYLQQLRDTAAGDDASRNGAGEQCPRCASHDTKFCYYNNYNTSQPRHFCRACRRYWTLGGSLRNVPIGGSTRKRPRLAHHHHQPASRRATHAFGPPMLPPLPPPPSQGGLLGSLFLLGGAAAPLLEGRGGAAGFDLGLGLPLLGAGEAAMQQLQGLGLGRGSGGSAPAGSAGAAASFLWPAGLLDGDSVDAWKMSGAGAGSAMWPDFSAAAAAPQTGGLMHGGAQLM